jgi:hypothetical protein
MFGHMNPTIPGQDILFADPYVSLFRFFSMLGLAACISLPISTVSRIGSRLRWFPWAARNKAEELVTYFTTRSIPDEIIAPLLEHLPDCSYPKKFIPGEV